MFSDTVIELNKGETVAELNKRLADLIAAVRSTGKGGALSLNLKVTPSQKGSGELVFVEADVKVKLPAPTKGSTLFFTTEDNRLSRRDERQEDLFPDRTGRVIDFVPSTVSSVDVKEAM